jgi:pimeloyl-ACP methyl ester carboxylesterase
MGVWRALGLSAVALGVATAGAGRVGAADAKRQTWEGTLKVSPTVQLRLIFHVRQADGGALSATMDSPDQGAEGLEVNAVTRDKSRLSFEMKNLGATFEGTLNAAGNEAVGTFTQGAGKFPLTLKMSEAPADAAKPAGNEQLWEGKLSVGAGLQLALVLHVFKDAAGALTAKFDSPDQGAKGLRVDSVTLDKSQLAFEMKSIGGKFQGKLSADGDVATGTWTQGGSEMPLTIRKTDRVTEKKRPQTPKPPFPYKLEDVRYENKAGAVTLAGTLTIPQGKGPFPAALLISGSGAQDRDETLFLHKPFAVIADALTRRGIAVLRVDDRGVGGSTGSTGKSTTEDFSGDVLAGVAYLKARPEIDARSIGLIGHSEGGIIAPMAAVKSKDVAFIVLMAGTALPGEDILYLQGRLIAQAMGAQKEALEFNRKIQESLFKVVRTEKDPKAVPAKLREALKGVVASLPEDKRATLEKLVQGQLAMVESPWFRFFLTYDPRPTLAKVRCPVLAIIGEKDLQVPPKENLAEIDKTLKEGGNRRVTVKELPGLNHLFQTCKTGSTAEYAQIEETVAPSALTIMGDWILDHVRRR